MSAITEEYELTEEQKERMAANKQKALKRKLELVEEAKNSLAEKADDPMSCQVIDPTTGIICGTQPVAKDLLLTFGESCCERCRHLSDDYTLMNKSDVATQFLIPQDSIKMMKFATKNNPRNTMFAPMKLYLRKHVTEKSFKRWGDADGLMKELDRRGKEKFDRGLLECEGALDKGVDDNGDDNQLILGNEVGEFPTEGVQKKGRKAKPNSAMQKRSAQLSKMMVAIRDTKS